MKSELFFFTTDIPNNYEVVTLKCIMLPTIVQKFADQEKKNT